MQEILLIILVLVALVVLVIQFLLIYSTLKYGIPPIPTSPDRMKKMIELADIKTSMTVYDLGCGDGRILRALHGKSLKRFGVEINPFMVLWARNINRIKSQDITIERKDFFTLDLSKADIIFCYLRPTIMEQMYKKIWPQLKNGCQVVSHGFPLPLEENKRIEVGPNIWVYKYIKS